MINSSEEKSRTKTAKDTEAKNKRRADQAQLVAGLQTILEADEQLLGFTRGLIAGGLRGKLTVGFEALFAPYVNIGLTERRVVLQHVQPESGKPNEILPHSFPLGELHSIAFSDIETFGGEPAGRLNLRLFNDQHFRLRFRGAEYVDNARTVADVFSSLNSTRPKARTSPTQSVCPHCDQILDRASRFCPYCGQGLDSAETPIVDTTVIIAPEHESDSADVPDSTFAPGEEPREIDVEGAGFAEGGPLNTTSESWDTDVQDEQVAQKIETVSPESPQELPTEGHESVNHGGDPHESDIEGDHPL